MFLAIIAVKEKPDYYVRTYFLPEQISDLLSEHYVAVEGTSSLVFQNLPTCDSVPGILSAELFGSLQAKTVKMEKRSFTVSWSHTSNGPEADRLALLALKKATATELDLALSWVEMRSPLNIDPNERCL